MTEEIKTGGEKIFSQGSEQLFIMDILEDMPKGKFLDIGAYDVFRFSNTRALYETGKWGGIFVEPAPVNYASIAEHYAADEKIQVLNIAIGETNGEIDFYDSNGDAIGTTDLSHKAKWEAGGVEYTKIKVKQMAVEDFFNQYGKDVDMISLDTERTNMVIFRLIPDWVWERLKLLVIEYDEGEQEIQDKLLNFGFNLLHKNGENLVLAKP